VIHHAVVNWFFYRSWSDLRVRTRVHLKKVHAGPQHISTRRVGKGAIIVLVDLVDGHPETFKVTESKCWNLSSDCLSWSGFNHLNGPSERITKSEQDKCEKISKTARYIFFWLGRIKEKDLFFEWDKAQRVLTLGKKSRRARVCPKMSFYRSELRKDCWNCRLVLKLGLLERFFHRAHIEIKRKTVKRYQRALPKVSPMQA
jgi:hypothetical protein